LQTQYDKLQRTASQQESELTDTTKKLEDVEAQIVELKKPQASQKSG
jgi:hypothetical protein